MDSDRFVAYGLGFLGLVSTALGIYYTFRKNRGDEHERQINQLYDMLDRQRKDHKEDMDDVKLQLKKCKENEDQSRQRELVSNALSTRQDDKIISLTAQVKNLTESLLAAGIDRRGQETTNS